MAVHRAKRCEDEEDEKEKASGSGGREDSAGRPEAVE
ncbi:predicted protein [Streptomyces iranensis]|uniref:Uncharacterized protein n=1 Tax=Streptomyces iranensis TaxID=576784 RepID=A0A060ZRQ7_9ACTN|nr:hypothetical protein [Streptomyces iranensis]CDR08882.1 predicted protein [Streptomyces iranensis]